MQIRPDAKHFFCRQDGRPVIRQFFVNVLDVCLLQTDWAPMTLTPHSFRQGRLCQGLFDGEDLAKLIRDGRWSMSSAAVEHYKRMSFAALTPQEIVQQCPEFHREWTAKKIGIPIREHGRDGGSSREPPTHPELCSDGVHCNFTTSVELYHAVTLVNLPQQECKKR